MVVLSLTNLRLGLELKINISTLKRGTNLEKLPKVRPMSRPKLICVGPLNPLLRTAFLNVCDPHMTGLCFSYMGLLAQSYFVKFLAIAQLINKKCVASTGWL
jgi:hypothetical protein